MPQGADSACARTPTRAPTGAADVWRRIAAIVAGPAANVLAAFVILTVFYGLGRARTTSRRRRSQQVRCNSPGEAQGLRPGDVVVGVQGRRDQGRRSSCAKTIETLAHGHPARAARRRAERTLGPADAAQGRRRRLLGFVFDVQRATARCTSAPLRSAHLAEQELWLVTKGTGDGAAATSSRAATAATSQGSVGIVREQSTAVGPGPLPRAARPGSRSRSRSSTCCRSCRSTAATSCSR